MEIKWNKYIIVMSWLLSLWLILAIYEVYKSSADAAWKAAILCLSVVLVVGYNILITNALKRRR